MGKKAKIVIGVVLGVIFVFIGIPLILFFFAPGAIPADPDRITGISQYFVLRDGSLYKARFSLVDANNAVVTSDAAVKWVVKADAAYGQELYRQEFNIKSIDFQTYQLVLTGAPVVAYSWQIDGNSFPEQFSSASSSTGLPRAKVGILEVTLPNGKNFTADTTFY
ncbi:MAG: hypothetical protein M3114_07390 [Thermoproteota archaeon]|nr:hypothetical protein [Thermoproteota archaeon]